MSIPGDFDHPHYYIPVFLDPKAWEAVYKHRDLSMVEMTYDDESIPNTPLWEYKMRGMVDFLIDGGSIKGYLETL